jgi:hypothetical protein
VYYLTIQTPNGETYISSALEHQEGKHKLLLEKPIVIGRENPDPDRQSDIKLPADDTLISRQHFCIERREGWFWVKKMPHSTHSTQVRRPNPESSDEVYLVENTTESYRLYDKDQILIRSKFPVSNNPYWIFTFYDENQTPFAEMKSSSISYRYNLTYRRLWINQSGSLIEIRLTTQREQLINYLAHKTQESSLAQKEQQNNNDFIDVASHEELIGHLWPKESSAATKVSLNNVIFQIHEHIKKEGRDKQLPKLIESVKRRGYRLVNCEVIDN